MDKAKPYGLGPDINSIFAFLRARFGISAIDARARLQRLPCDPHTTLQEHAATVMKLAQIAYSNLPQANRERYTYDAFVQSVNDLGLHHQFLARGVTTVEGALAEGEAYLLANHMHKNHRVSRQVDIEPSAALADPNAGPPARQCGTADGRIEGRTTDRHVSQASLHIDPKDQVGTAREPFGPPAQSPGTGHNLCWECERPGHFQRYCPLIPQGLNYRGPQMFPPTAGWR